MTSKWVGMSPECGAIRLFILPMKVSQLLVFLYLQCNVFFPVGAYDALDPFGNITINWDVQEWREDQNGFVALVTIYNNQLYRHVDKPGWKLRWEWPGKEVIWGMWGAEATERGNCTKYRSNFPHSCEKTPTIIDLLPGTPYNQQTGNCCRGGVLSSMRQNPSKSVSSFQISVGDATVANGKLSMPTNFDLGIPGYTCGPAVNVTPTKYPIDGGRRWIQALWSFEITCSYSVMMSGGAPSCCVSLSSFYNDTIVRCPFCSCGCEDGLSPSKCATDDQLPQIPRPSQTNRSENPRLVRCTSHMCPIRVHWHVKVSYRGYWRVKMTVTNFNLMKNYSEWNLVVQHPNLGNVTQVFSFNYKPLDIYPGFNESALFWGVPHYNDMLLQYGDDGHVQTEMLLRKNPEQFTFQAGWTFPRRVYFNGEPCVLPPPDLYPQLPNGCSRKTSPNNHHLSRLPLLLLLLPTLFLLL